MAKKNDQKASDEVVALDINNPEHGNKTFAELQGQEAKTPEEKVEDDLAQLAKEREQ